MAVPKILIVDDTPENIDILRQVLVPIECKVLIANSGERALDIISKNPPDLILLDVMMPGIDGFDVCKAIRTNAQTKEIPIIFVTGRQDDVTQGFAVGGNDYITKPINTDEVLSRVRHQLERLFLINELKHLNDELEEKVRERTAALAVVNRQLREEINERRFMQDRLRYLAEHDFVTRLYNRNALDTQVTETIGKVQLERIKAAFLQLDLDQFRLINESCGCIAGDELLREVGSLLSGCLTGDDFLARLGGDKFAIVCSNKTLLSADALAKRAQKQLNEYLFSWEGRQFKLAVSIAIVNIDENVASFDQLLLMADEALYLAKKEGRNTIRNYDEKTPQAVSHRSSINWALRLVDALKNNYFEVYIQHITNIVDNNVKSSTKLKLEALIRLHDVEHNKIIYPDDFIPAAERFRLISEIDRYVINNVAEFLSAHPDLHNRIDSIAINLSAISIREPDLSQFIQSTLARLAVDPRLITFEITETESIYNMTHTRQFMLSLKAIGCRFSLDDFGSGYASFNYLRELPFDIVKIDGVFVKDMDKIDAHAAMVKSIVEIAHKLEKEVVAEFVENKTIHLMLQGIQVHWGQGYYYHKPEPLTHECITRLSAST